MDLYKFGVRTAIRSFFDKLKLQIHFIYRRRNESSSPSIVAYFINYNDSFYIPFFAKHYFKFCEKIIMYDNYSTDNSVELAKSLGIQVEYFGKKGELNDEAYRVVKNNVWKEQRNKKVNYVIVCDVDEFLCIDDLKGTAPNVQGFNMVSNHLPVDDILEIKTGGISDNYSKQAIFNPNAIEEINYDHGCHQNHMKGVISKGGACRLLHYRQIGGVQRVLDRHAEYRIRMSSYNLKHGFGMHYLDTDEQKRTEWDNLIADAKELW